MHRDDVSAAHGALCNCPDLSPMPAMDEGPYTQPDTLGAADLDLGHFSGGSLHFAPPRLEVEQVATTASRGRAAAPDTQPHIPACPQ